MKKRETNGIFWKNRKDGGRRTGRRLLAGLCAALLLAAAPAAGAHAEELPAGP